MNKILKSLAALHFDKQSEDGVQSTLLLSVGSLSHLQTLEYVRSEQTPRNETEQDNSCKCKTNNFHVLSLHSKETAAPAQQGKAKREARAPRFTRARAKTAGEARN